MAEAEEWARLVAHSSAEALHRATNNRESEERFLALACQVVSTLARIDRQQGTPALRAYCESLSGTARALASEALIAAAGINHPYCLTVLAAALNKQRRQLEASLAN